MGLFDKRTSFQKDADNLAKMRRDRDDLIAKRDREDDVLRDWENRGKFSIKGRPSDERIAEQAAKVKDLSDRIQRLDDRIAAAENGGAR